MVALRPSMAKIGFNKETRLLLSASASPGNSGTFFYNYFFKRHGLNAVYLSRKVDSAEELARAIRCLNVYGCSVSMPLKSSIIEHLDQTSDLARSVGSVNTIRNLDGKLFGDNTDYTGFLHAIQHIDKVGLKQIERVAIYGYGSVTRTVIKALRSHTPSLRISVFGRRLDAAKRFAQEQSVDVGMMSELDAQKFDLLVNTTPASAAPPAELIEILDRSHAVFDLVSTLSDTELVSIARGRRMPLFCGFEMFKYQFIEQYRLYFGIVISEDQFEEALKEFKNN